jgi:hypothetical protein
MGSSGVQALKTCSDGLQRASGYPAAVTPSMGGRESAGAFIWTHRTGPLLLPDYGTRILPGSVASIYMLPR